MGAFLREWILSVRRIRKSFGASASVIVGVALAIGINCGVYTLADNFLSAGKDDEFYLIGARPKNPARDYFHMFDVKLLRSIEDNVRSFRSLARVADYTLTLTEVQMPVLLQGLRVGGRSPEALPITVTKGRSFRKEDFAPSAEKTVLLGRSAWMAGFATAEASIGQMVRLNGVPHRVIGILPDDFSFHHQKFDVVSASSFTEPTYAGLSGDNIWLVGQLKDGVTAAAATSEVRSLESDLKSIGPPGYFRTNTLKVQKVSAWAHTLAHNQVRALITAAWGILLLAAVALAGYAAVRLNTLRTECAVRIMMGADLRSLARLLLIENSTVLVLATGLGVLLGYGLVRIVATQFQGAQVGLLYLLQGFIHFDWTIVGYTALAGLAILVIISAIILLLLSPKYVSNLIKEQRSTPSSTFKLTYGVLLFLQTCATCAITISGALFLVSLDRVRHHDYGFSPNGIVQTEVHLPTYSFTGPQAPERLNALMASVLEAVKSVPGIKDEAISKLQFPQWPDPDGVRLRTTPADADATQLPQVQQAFVGPGWLELIGLRLIRGRTLQIGDEAEGAEGVVVVNQAFANRYLDAGEEIGQQLEARGRKYRVCGVVSDIRDIAPTPLARVRPAPALYFTSNQDLGWESWAVVNMKANVWNGAMEKQIRTAIEHVNGEIVVSEFIQLPQRLEQSENTFKVVVSAQSLVGLLGCILACITIYSAVTYSVAQQRREIGVRLTVGATPVGIRNEVLKRTLMLVAPAALIGAVIAYVGIARYGLFDDQLYLVDTRSLPIYAVGAAGIVVVGLLAAWYPAIGAARLDPNKLLREA